MWIRRIFLDLFHYAYGTIKITITQPLSFTSFRRVPMERLKQKSRNLFRPFILSIFTKYCFVRYREYIVYLVPILMLLFIGSLVVMLICLRVRGCEFDFLLPFRTNQADSSGSANGFVRNQSQMPDGEMVVMTDIVDVLPHNGSNNNSRLRSGNYVWDHDQIKNWNLKVRQKIKNQKKLRKIER